MFLEKIINWFWPKPKSLFQELHTPSCDIAIPEKSPTGFIEWLEVQTEPQTQRLHELLGPLTQIPSHRKQSYGWLYENMAKNEECRNHPNYPEIMRLLGEIII